MEKGLFLNGTCCLLPLFILLSPVLMILAALYLMIFIAFGIGILMIVGAIIISIIICCNNKKEKESTPLLYRSRLILFILGIIFMMPLLIYRFFGFIHRFVR